MVRGVAVLRDKKKKISHILKRARTARADDSQSHVTERRDESRGGETGHTTAAPVRGGHRGEVLRYKVRGVGKRNIAY